MRQQQRSKAPRTARRIMSIFGNPGKSGAVKTHCPASRVDPTQDEQTKVDPDDEQEEQPVPTA